MKPDRLVRYTVILFAAVFMCADAIGEQAEYVIITTKARADASKKLDEFVNAKKARGLTVKVVTEEVWGGGATGDALADNLRKWLSENYKSLGIKFVLLIGDPHPTTGDVPMKICYPGGPERKRGDVPTDFYYSELSGNWDLNGNGSYGELSDFGDGGLNLQAEVQVGRIPCFGVIVGYPVFSGKGTDDMLSSGRLPKLTDAGTFTVEIVTAGSPGKFIYSSDDGKTWSKPVDITGGSQELESGITIGFKGTTGYTKSAQWKFEVDGSKKITPVFSGEGLDALTVKIPKKKRTKKDPKKDPKKSKPPKKSFIVKIQSTGKPDTIRHCVAGSKTWSKSIAIIPGSNHKLSPDISVKFELATGHSAGDKWTFEAREHLDSILQKTINYENAELSSIGWRLRTLLPMAALGKNYLSHPLGEHIKQHVIVADKDWSCYRIYQKDYKLNPPQDVSGVSFDSVLKAWQAYNPGVVCWMGHGKWPRARNLFHGNQAHKLNDTRPVINFHVSCSTGMPEKPMNLGACMLRNGAIAVVCGTRVTYGEARGDLEKSSTDAGNAFRFVQNVVTNRKPVAGALNEARSRYAIRSITGLINALANNVYGCPAISIYSHRPSADGSPAWFPDYPQAGREDEDGFDVLVRSDSKGKAYYVVLDQGDDKPTIAQVKAGQDAAGKSIPQDRKGTITLRPYIRTSGRVESLEAATQYDIYVVAEDVESSAAALTRIIGKTGAEGVTFGSVSCKITPPEAISHGAKWRLTAGSDLYWKPSGETIEDLPQIKGGYTVEFSEVSVWSKPVAVSKLVLSAKTVTNLNGVYTEDDMEDNDTPETAMVVTAGTIESLKCVDDDWFKLENIPAGKKITIAISSEDKPVNLNLDVWSSARKIDENNALATGLRSKTNISAVVNPTAQGDYLIEVAGKKLSYFNTVTRSNYKLTIVIGNAELGKIVCKISPDSAIKAGARWRLTTGIDTEWHKSGHRIDSAQAGAMLKIEFNDVAGHFKPADRELLIAVGQKMSLKSTYGISAAKTAIEFEEQAIPLATIEKGETLLRQVDLDLDGDMDIVYANTVKLSYKTDKGTGKLVWLANDGNKIPSFKKYVIKETIGGYIESLSVVDINKDGKADVLVNDLSNKRILLYLNNGDQKSPSFTEIILSSFKGLKGKPWLLESVTADIDNDGDLDVLTCSAPGGIIWHENDGSSTPVFKDHKIVSEEAYLISAADIDGDGDLDIITKHDNLLWYENDGKEKPTFKKGATIANDKLSKSYIRFATSVDMDGDGDMDILTTGSVTRKVKGGEIAWFENIAGDGSCWARCSITFAENANYKVFATDIDGDGDIDVMSLNDDWSRLPDTKDKLSWFENIAGDSSTWVHNAVGSRKDGFRLSNILWVDIDGDGQKDMAYAEPLSIIMFKNKKALAEK